MHGCRIPTDLADTTCAPQERATPRCDFSRIAAGKTIFLYIWCWNDKSSFGLEQISPLFYGVICSRPNDDLSCQYQMYKKMVFPAAIREKLQRGVALSCDTHVVSAKSVGIRQPCTESLSETASCRTFLSVQHFCAGNSGVLWSYLFQTERLVLVRSPEVQKDGFPGRDS